MASIQAKSSKTFNFRSLARGLGQLALSFILTLLLLEIATRLIWWGDKPLELLGRRVALLPLPLVTADQITILDNWAQDSGTYIQFDPVLGWSIRPGVTAEWEGAIYTSNSIGIRSLREYELTPPEGIIRMAAFGPSFTHSDEVQGHETWEAQLEAMRPDLEVMNWGVGGYGTDQAFLRYQTQGVMYQPDIVIIGFEEENVSRNVNRFRSFYRPGTGLPLTKPTYILEGQKLVLVKNPFTNFAEFYQVLRFEPDRFIDLVCPHDLFCEAQLYRPHSLDVFATFRFLRTLMYEINVDPPARELERQAQEGQISLGLIQMFVEEIVHHQAVPLVVVFPEQGTMAEYEEGVLPSYHTGVIALRDAGVQVIDLASAFAEVKRTQNLEYRDFYASEGGHFSPFGNQVVAQTIFWHLCSQGLLKECS